ncbi:MAG: class I SAM-dependent methyltransferase [Candidatus Cloacimonetes bacterium]|nr:class I SAM-dependent methyltransferase [Candidatus Cloacimonadota bacterium]
MDKIREYLSGLKLTTALDVATGRGEFIGIIQQLAGEGIKITGVDSSEKMLKLAARHNPEVEFCIGDAYDLTFRDESFDLACLSNSLHHFETPQKVIAELKRVLMPGGHLLIQEMVCDEDQTAAQKSHIMLHHYCAEIDMLSSVHHEKTWDSRKISDFLRKEAGEIGLESEYSYPMEDEFDEKLMDRNIMIVDHFMTQVAEREDKEVYNKRGEELKAYLAEHGFAPAREKLYLITK